MNVKNIASISPKRQEREFLFVSREGNTNSLIR